MYAQRSHRCRGHLSNPTVWCGEVLFPCDSKPASMNMSWGLCALGPPTKVVCHLPKKKYKRADLAGGDRFWAGTHTVLQYDISWFFLGLGSWLLTVTGMETLILTLIHPSLDINSHTSIFISYLYLYLNIRRPRQTQGGARQGIILLTVLSDYYRSRRSSSNSRRSKAGLRVACYCEWFRSQVAVAEQPAVGRCFCCLCGPQVGVGGSSRQRQSFNFLGVPLLCFGTKLGVVLLFRMFRKGCLAVCLLVWRLFDCSSTR